MAKKKKMVTNAMRMLTAKKIPFETLEYEADEIGENFGVAIANKLGISADVTFKTLVGIGDKTGPVVAVIPVDKEVDLKKLAVASANKSVGLIHVKELLDLTGYIRGGVSPIGMKKLFPTYIDDSCQGLEKMAVSGGVCGLSLLIEPKLLCDVTKAKIFNIT